MKVSFHSLVNILGSLCSSKVLVLICDYRLLFVLGFCVVDYRLELSSKCAPCFNYPQSINKFAQQG
jgi:hypothetical protein